MRKSLALFPLAVGGAALGSLLAGAAYCEWALPGGLPLGNVLAALALCAPAAAAVVLSPAGSWRRRASRAVLWAAALWLPLSVALAGNLALNFAGARGTAWLWLSLCTFVAALAALAWSLLGLLRHAGRGARMA
ncbi:MAG TPA: hypothetical protein VFF91_00750 [Pseudoxanthomonas sp.]|nr:hypothetical protein [Pseudoxanthomonas sp.]